MMMDLVMDEREFIRVYICNDTMYVSKPEPFGASALSIDEMRKKEDILVLIALRDERTKVASSEIELDGGGIE